jgi:hypothetical protein
MQKYHLMTSLESPPNNRIQLYFLEQSIASLQYNGGGLAEFTVKLDLPLNAKGPTPLWTRQGIHVLEQALGVRLDTHG